LKAQVELAVGDGHGKRPGDRGPPAAVGDDVEVVEDGLAFDRDVEPARVGREIVVGEQQAERIRTAWDRIGIGEVAPRSA
jgi:hypothetical protein